MAITTTPATKILFIGDSITDCQRTTDPEKMGQGYVRYINDWLRASRPATAPQVINMGISGQKVTDLAERWERDVLAMSPDVLSIMIGINDVWHGLAHGSGGVPIETYQEVYRDNLRRVKETLPKCQLVLCEPTVIWRPASADGNELLQPYIRAIHELVEEFGAGKPVPMHRAFVEIRRQRPDLEWTYDGVHPTSSGHMLIARTWLDTTGLL